VLASLSESASQLSSSLDSDDLHSMQLRRCLADAEVDLKRLARISGKVSKKERRRALRRIQVFQGKKSSWTDFLSDRLRPQKASIEPEAAVRAIHLSIYEVVREYEETLKDWHWER